MSVKALVTKATGMYELPRKNFSTYAKTGVLKALSSQTTPPMLVLFLWCEKGKHFPLMFYQFNRRYFQQGQREKPQEIQCRKK